MSTTSKLVEIEGDSQKTLHRVSLLGNALFFDQNRWVLLGDGADTLPFLQIPLTFSVAFFNQRTGAVSFSGGGNVIFNQGLSDWVAGQGRVNLYILYGGTDLLSQISLALHPSTVSTGRKSVSININTLNRRSIFSVAYNATPIVENPNNTMNGRRYTGLINASVTRNTTSNFAAMGAYPNRRLGSVPRTAENAFLGYIRNFEILLDKECSSAELRAIHNYGTIYAAHQAGKVAISDLKNLISIDLSGTNGNPPAGCRPGTRQITVTPYNDSTPDPTGSGCTYADFNLL
jgi:hypothetical protein